MQEDSTHKESFAAMITMDDLSADMSLFCEAFWVMIEGDQLVESCSTASNDCGYVKGGAQRPTWTVCPRFRQFDGMGRAPGSIQEGPGTANLSLKAGLQAVASPPIGNPQA